MIKNILSYQLNIKLLNRFTVKLFLILIFSAYIVPLLAAFFLSDIFTYVNAWDEETYLTLQAAKEGLTYPGYMVSSFIVYTLQNLGVSGAIQNLLFDLLLIPTVAVFIFFTAVNLGVSKTRSSLYVLLILFSSVLFNYANPYIVELYGAKRHVSIIMPGYESYPSILRSPQPQISYLLISLCALAWSQSRNYLWLLLPLPFLYFFVAVGHSFVIGMILLTSFFSGYKEKLSSESLLWGVVIPGVCIFLIASLFFVLAAYFVVVITGNPVSIWLSKVYQETRAFNIPLAFMGLMPFILFILYKYFKGVSIGLEGLSFLYVALSILLVANMHIMAGYTVSYKNLHDYAISIMSGLALCLFFESVHRHQLLNISFSRILQFLLLSLILMFTLYSQGFNFREGRFRIFVGQKISQDELKMVKDDPLRAGVYSRNLSAKLAYAHAGMPILPFSYQYYYLPHDRLNLDSAMEAAKKKYLPESPQLIFFEKMYNTILKHGTASDFAHNKESALSEYFFVEPKGSPFIYFP